MECTTHPERAADWACLACGEWACDDCVKVVEVRGARLETCPHCGGVLTRQAEPAPPWHDALKEALRRPFGPQGIIAALGLAVFAWVALVPLPVVREIFFVLYATALFGYGLEVVDHVARGEGGLPVPASSSTGADSFVAALGRGVVLAVAVLAPWLLLRAVAGDDPPWALEALALLAGAAYAPALLVATILGHSALAALWPPGWLRIAACDVRQYAEVTAVSVGAVLAAVAVLALLRQALGWLLLVGPFVAVSAAQVLLLLLPVAVGAYLREHAAELGFRAPLVAAAPPPDDAPDPA